MARKIIAVVGATGAQGGGLVEAILADPSGEFAARALTRTPDSEKAKALAARGVEVVEADLDDVDSLTKAFDGAYGAFCVTNFWEHFSPEREKAQAENLAEAATRAGIEHAIWSTLDDTREYVPLEDDRMPTLQEKYKVPHFDAKGEADRYFEQRKVPTTYLLTTFYWDNMVHFGMHPKPGADGVLELVLPMGDRRLSGIAANDIGKVAFGIFRDGPENAGKRIGIAGEHLTGEQMAEAMADALGRDVRYVSITPEKYRSFGFPGADDLGNMFQFYKEFETQFVKSRSVERAREFHPELQDFRGWLDSNAERIPMES